MQKLLNDDHDQIDAMQNEDSGPTDGQTHAKDTLIADSKVPKPLNIDSVNTPLPDQLIESVIGDKSEDKEISNSPPKGETCLADSNKVRKNLRAKKRKKTKEEVAILEAYYQQDPSWSRKTVKALKYKLTNLTVDQIYKWGYDKKNLMKKQKAQMKARKTKVQQKAIDFTVSPKKISDFNQEVEDLCHLDTGMSVDLMDSPDDKILNTTRSKVRKLSKFTNSFNSKETFPTTQEKETEIEDDPFFYNSKVETFYYVANTDHKIQRPHRTVGKKGLFRIPSGFFNMDFYTYKDEAFKNDNVEFFAELYKEE